MLIWIFKCDSCPCCKSKNYCTLSILNKSQSKANALVGTLLGASNYSLLKSFYKIATNHLSDTRYHIFIQLHSKALHIFHTRFNTNICDVKRLKIREKLRSYKEIFLFFYYLFFVWKTRILWNHVFYEINSARNY